MVKKSACNAGDRVQALGQEDALEKEVATDSSILARRIPWTEEPDGLQSMGLHMTEALQQQQQHFQHQSQYILKRFTHGNSNGFMSSTFPCLLLESYQNGVKC